MNALQEQWVEALESGEYKQGQRNLCYEDKYCCLGVACEVMGVEKTYIGDTVRFGNCLVTLSERLMNKLGIEKQSHFIVMNDSGKSFKEIAQYIRDNYDI